MNEPTITIPLFGATIDIVLYETAEVVAAALREEIKQEALRLQKIFNLYDEESELSRLNRERVLDCSSELRTVLEAALPWCERTAGKYDITHGRAFLQRKAGQPCSQLGCSYRDIRISGKKVTLAHPDALLDLGSIAKGYIVDKLIDFIHALGIEGIFIDARGDIRISGRHLEVVDIQHPRAAGSAGSFILEHGAAATSGDYRQHAGSFEKSHLLGATTASVTVLAPTLIEADVIATVLSLEETALPEGISAIIINKSGERQELGERRLLEATP